MADLTQSYEQKDPSIGAVGAISSKSPGAVLANLIARTDEIKQAELQKTSKELEDLLVQAEKISKLKKLIPQDIPSKDALPLSDEATRLLDDLKKTHGVDISVEKLSSAHLEIDSALQKVNMLVQQKFREINILAQEQTEVMKILKECIVDLRDFIKHINQRTGS